MSIQNNTAVDVYQNFILPTALDSDFSSEDLADDKREEELLFYMECWCELQGFWAEAVRDNAGEYPFAEDVLNLMRSIERKYEQ